MSTANGPALELRRLLTDAYLAEDAPPGADRASWFITALLREPDNEDVQRMARDILTVIELRARLLSARDTAGRVDAPHVALVIHGLIGHADAELCGSTHNPGWRAAALDLLEPDGQERKVLPYGLAVRLFALAMGVDEADDETPDDAAGD
jgi:hypothetical protein